MLIEYGTYNDTDEMEQLYSELTEMLETGVNYPGWKKGIYPVREDAMAGIAAHNLFVARRDHKIIGSIILNHKPEKGYDTVTWQYAGDYDKVLVVHTLAVHPAYLKSGIGRVLMEFAESFGLENKMKAIRLDVYEKNLPAVRLYESCGYQYRGMVDLGLGCYGLDRFKLFEKLL